MIFLSSKRARHAKPKTMKLMLSFVYLFALASFQAACSKAPDSAAHSSPKALVADLYKQPDAGLCFQTTDRELVGRYFTERTARFILKDTLSTPEGEIGALDFDPLYDAQDFDIKNLGFRERRRESGKAEVVASFENIGIDREITFSLIFAGAGWRIDDIIYSDGRTLVAILSGR